MKERLAHTLREAGLDQDLVTKVLDSGYYLRDWCDPFSQRTWSAVSDQMYGNKQFSSHFETSGFIEYLRGKNPFPTARAIPRYKAESLADIETIIADPRRARSIKEGLISFRGQHQEYQFRRPVPNPVRGDKDGFELSILPGIYRQRSADYSFAQEPRERRSFDLFLHHLEPNNPEVWLDATHAYDIMRVEQHYASQTAGLDVSFEIEAALFFATHRFQKGPSGRACYQQIAQGSHKGVIYCFRFRDPPVKKTEYYIRDFDLFKTLRPERVLRQNCALPIIGPHERNIAVTDLECVIDLSPDFSGTAKSSSAWMFPDTSADPFYRKLLELKDAFPEELEDVVEYEWARAPERPTPP